MRHYFRMVSHSPSVDWKTEQSTAKKAVDLTKNRPFLVNSTQSSGHGGIHTNLSPTFPPFANPSPLSISSPSLPLSPIPEENLVSPSSNMSSSPVPSLPDFQDAQFAGVTPEPTAAEATTRATAIATTGDVIPHAAAATSSIGTLDIGIVERTLPLPTKTEIWDGKYLGLRTILAAEVFRRKLHVIVHQNKRSEAWNAFYCDCLCKNGIMKRFMWSKSATPGKAFRGVVYSGIEWDAERYHAADAEEREPSELEILSSILIIEQDDAQAAHKEMAADKKKKDNKERAENEAAEVQLRLRGGPGLASPSPTTTVRCDNPTSLSGSGGSGSRMGTGEISFCVII